MNRRLVIVGAGGHGKVLADIAMRLEYRDICFVDDRAQGICLGFPVVGTCDALQTLDDGKTDFVIGIGDNAVRKRISESHRVSWAKLVHPSAQIAADVRIGVGTVVMAGAIVNVSAAIGEHCILNTGSIVEHDCVVGDYVHLSPRAVLGGIVQVGELTHIGIGAVVRNNIRICPEVTVGAGAVVVKDIRKSGVYVGVPAREML